MRLDVDVEMRTRVVSVPLKKPGHNECAAEIRVVFERVFGEDILKWPKWADDAIYSLAGRMSADALRSHPLRRVPVPCRCIAATPAQGSGWDDGFIGEEHCSECGGVDRNVLFRGARTR